MYSTAMQRPYFWPSGPMNVFMSIHDPSSHWLVCRKINKFNHHLFDLRIYSYHQNSQTSKHRCGARYIVQLCSALISDPLDPWMCLCRFMIHRVIDWCVAKTTNSTITYLITESTRIIRILKQANIVADPDEQHIHATPLLLSRWTHECIYSDSWSIETLIGVMLKTTNSTITYFIFPQNHLRVK